MKDIRAVRQYTERRLSLARRVHDIWIYQPQDRDQEVGHVNVGSRRFLHERNSCGVRIAQGSFVAEAASLTDAWVRPSGGRPGPSYGHCHPCISPILG